MLTLQQLINLTKATYNRVHKPARMLKRSQNPIIRVYKDNTPAGKKFRAVYIRTSLYNKDASGASYTLIIRNYGTKKDPKDFTFKPESQLWVHCSCPYFKFYLEVVLHLYGSSSIYDSNGDMPVIKNPTYKPYLCKHLYATLLHLVHQDSLKGRK